MKIKFNEPIEVAAQEFIIVEERLENGFYKIEKRISSKDGYVVHWENVVMTKDDLRNLLNLKKREKLEVI